MRKRCRVCVQEEQPPLGLDDEDEYACERPSLRDLTFSTGITFLPPRAKVTEPTLPSLAPPLSPHLALASQQPLSELWLSHDTTHNPSLCGRCFLLLTHPSDLHVRFFFSHGPL